MDSVLPRTPADGRPHRDDGIDAVIEELALDLAREVDPHRRAALRERIVLIALPLADGIARRYTRRGIETDDLVQVARTALLTAVHRYRPGTGSGFFAYASPTVSGELKRWFRDHGWSVRPPRRIQELRAQLGAEEERMRHALGREPQCGELAAALGATAEDVAEARRCSEGYRAASLDVVTPAGAGLADSVLVMDCPTTRLAQLDALGWAMSRLSPRQQLILRLRFVEELTQEQIGTRIGVSQMQVSRLLRGALDRLRADLDLDTDAESRQPAA